MDFSLGLSKLHEHPLPNEDVLLNDCMKCRHLAGKELFARSNQPLQVCFLFNPSHCYEQLRSRF